MKFSKVCLLFITSWISILNALPARVFVKNETKETQIISGVVSHIATRFATGGGSSGFLIQIAPGKEMEIEAYRTSIGTISEATIKIAGNPVDLGNYPISRIIIFQKDDMLSTRVEPPSRYMATRMAMTNWWSKTQNSWSSFWKKMFHPRT